MDPKNVRLESFKSGRAPILDAHFGYSLSSQVGIIEGAQLDGKRGVASLRYFEGDPAADEIWNKIQQGAKNVSMGALIHKLREAEGSDESQDIRRFEALDWEPVELSNVSIGGDPGAQIQMQFDEEGLEFIEVELLGASAQTEQEDSNMKKEAAGAGEAREVVQQPAVGQEQLETARDEARAEGAELERTRASGIRKLAAPFPTISTGTVEKLIADGVTVETAQGRILDLLATQDEKTPTRSANGSVVQVTDERDTYRGAVSNALLHRMSPDKVKLESGRDYRGMSLMEIAKDSVARTGASVLGLDRLTLLAVAFGFEGQRLAGMNTTSDFPLILANVMNKTLRRGYTEAPQTWRAIATRGTAPDFKEMQRTQLGAFPTPEAVNEAAEFTYGTLSEGKEVFSLGTYGKLIAISRKTIINDDLGAFARLARMGGAAVARLESNVVWALITANAAMGDGTALFHADHANLAGTPGAPSNTTLGVARQAIREQTDVDGNTLNLGPAYVIVPPDHETLVDGLLTAIAPTTAANANLFAAGGTTPLTKIAEPRLGADSATAWYLAANPAEIEIIEYCYLEGQEQIFTEYKVGFEVDGQVFKVRQDFCAKVLDHRGLFKNAGA